MTTHHASSAEASHATAAPKPEDRPGYQEYPKVLYREPPGPVPDAPPESVEVPDKKGEDAARADGYVSGPEWEKQQADAAKHAKADKPKTKA